VKNTQVRGIGNSCYACAEERRVLLTKGFFSAHSKFLWTKDRFFKKSAMNVRPLRDPSTEAESGNDAYWQSRSQNSIAEG
jgi:hypothetical protein